MKQEQMTDVQAMDLLAQICAAYKGNFAEHQLLQQALRLVGAKVLPVPVPVKEPETIKPDFNGKDKKKK